MDRSSKAFIRRVKKHIRARVHRIDVLVTPHWKELCRRELVDLGFECEDAGPSVLRTQGRIWDAYRLCLRLRTASRVGICIPGFKCFHADGLYMKAREIPWELWINPEIPVHYYSNVERSKIRHEGLVRDTLHAAIADRFRSCGVVFCGEEEAFDESRELEKPRQRIWISVIRNLCSVRLDMTGAHLHQRGYRLYPGPAPLRETLAAVLLELAEWNGDMPLVDGMTGSGTVAVEAALKALKIPPGFFRSFLFELWPSFQEGFWKHEKRVAQAEMALNRDIRIVAIDRSSGYIRLAKENARRAGVEDRITWIRTDFFGWTPQNEGLEKGLLFLNPPYGKRITTAVTEMYRKIFAHIDKYYRGWRVMIILPDKNLLSLYNRSPVTLTRLPHGGLWIYAGLFEL
ncbi:THUMP domain-containing class I SAM-dependent RNA methyltransferase [Thermodesulforhabdus norvegica]|uniref:THUMP domain-containing class I SAM-dependent RNA methyltransferase n=1 Tax=Thermodesulforhabdus norvegica TaxID=39841 RepID=UPI0015A56259|nr:hypothetical protein [Thermodesulforhabdus norvegica]